MKLFQFFIPLLLLGFLKKGHVLISEFHFFDFDFGGHVLCLFEVVYSDVFVAEVDVEGV